MTQPYQQIYTYIRIYVYSQMLFCLQKKAGADKVNSMDKNKPTAAKERFTTTLNAELLQEIKILAIRHKCAANTLLEEAMKDLLVKYKDKASHHGEPLQGNAELPMMVHEEGGAYKKEI